MSLNGLDDAKVKEALEAASTDPGGWFLLKYAARDEVEILDHGTGGVVETRNAIAKYEEISPLYGFLRYRRRNVIVKYMPEDCSRLVKARAAVHFNAVCEHFTHGTTFEISVAKDLKDSKLSAACSLHTASGSTSSSSSSLRRRRLNEIAEEEEEDERERKRQSIVKEEERSEPPNSFQVPRSPSLLPGFPAVLDPQQPSNPRDTAFASTTDVPDFTGLEDRPASPTKSESTRRLSTQSARPDLFSYSTYTYGKPKVKLGPRPSLETHKRPSTAGNFRPISALPAGFKLISKGPKKDKTRGHGYQVDPDETKQDPHHHAPIASMPIPEIQESPDSESNQRPTTSSGASVKSLTPSTTPSTKDSKISPEKARLLKAMKLREKRMTAVPSLKMASKARTSLDEEQGHLHHKDPTNTLHSEKIGVAQNFPNTAANDLPIPAPINVEMEVQSESTVPDSHPPSPTAASSSEVGESTKASSLSESTDETVLAAEKHSEHEGGPEPRDRSDKPPETSDEQNRNSDVAQNSVKDLSETGGSLPPIITEDNVSVMETDKDSGESHQIPELEQRPTHTIDPAIRALIEDSESVSSSVSEIHPESVEAIEAITRDTGGRKSPWGVPLSKFSSKEQKPEKKSPISAASPTTPSLKSKFSRQDLTIPTNTAPVAPEITAPAALLTEDNKPERLPKDEPTPTLNPEIILPPVQRSNRRKTIIDPIRTDLPPKDTPQSESSDPLDDDALMDELQSATVQEARPITVSKSPMTPVFPNSSPPRPLPVSRAVSSPMRGPFLGPNEISQSSARSVSAGGAAYLHNVTRQPSNASLQSKKSNLGSSISQRIKALEKLSGSTANDETRPKTATPSASFFAVRKQSTREPMKSPHVADRAGSFTHQTSPPQFPRETTPERHAPTNRGRSGSVASRLTMFEGQSAPRGRPDSIQVTARIIRDSSATSSKKPEVQKTSADSSTTELKESPLVVDVQTARPDPSSFDSKLASAEPIKETIQERRERKSSLTDGDKKAKRRSSLSIMKDFIKDKTSPSPRPSDNLAVMSPATISIKSPGRPPSSHQNTGGFVRRLSISSRRSVSRERDKDSSSASTPRISPLPSSDCGSGDDDKSISEKKSKNRATRFMRRLSNSLGGNRKSISANISPTVAEEDADQIAASAIANNRLPLQPEVVAHMGDVNVQFPDNLLWKRRSMSLDSQGFIILSAVQGAARSGREMAGGTGVKRYHMTDFRAPFIPDVEVQELVNSVVLDFVEGSCLQIACEDRAGQLGVLQALQDAHQNQSSFES